jgi:phospholipase/lecithinase/hemolysin
MPLVRNGFRPSRAVAAALLVLAVLTLPWWWFGPCGIVAHLPGVFARQILAYFPCKGPPLNRLWVFGDSTVDSGWFRIAPFSGEQNFDAYIMQPALGVGRPTSSPGAMSVEVLANAIHATNYATGGARDVAMNTAATGGFPNAVPTAMQIANYLSANTPGARDFLLVSSGDNDVAYALRENLADPNGYVQEQAQALAGSIQALALHGAKYIMVVGLPESFGSPPLKRTLRALHDSTLRAALTQSGVSYVWADFDALRKFAEQGNGGTSPFGLAHYFNSNPACSGPPAGISSDWAYVCSPASTGSTPAADANTYEFADDSHLATGGQKVLGGYFLCLAQARWQMLNWSGAAAPYGCELYAPVIPVPY